MGFLWLGSIVIAWRVQIVELPVNFVLKTMNFVLEMMNFVLKTINFVFFIDEFLLGPVCLRAASGSH